MKYQDEMKLTDKQQNCPYCHKRINDYAEPLVGDLNDIGAGLIHEDDGWHFASWDFDVMKTTDDPVAVCSICKRPLNEEEE